MNRLFAFTNTSSIFSALILFLFSPPLSMASDEENIGWVTEISGKASITHPATGKSEPAKEGTEVYKMDVIETTANTSVTVQLEDDSIFTVGGSSKVEVSDFVNNVAEHKNYSFFKLLYGKFRGLLNSKFKQGSEMSIETPTSVAGVKGSDFSVWIEDGETVVAVTEGEGYMKHRDKRYPGIVKMRAGHMLRAKMARALGKPGNIPDRIRDRIKKLPVRKKLKLMKKLRETKKNKQQGRMKQRKTIEKKIRQHRKQKKRSR